MDRTDIMSSMGITVSTPGRIPIMVTIPIPTMTTGGLVLPIRIEDMVAHRFSSLSADMGTMITSTKDTTMLDQPCRITATTDPDMVGMDMAGTDMSVATLTEDMATVAGMNSMGRRQTPERSRSHALSHKRIEECAEKHSNCFRHGRRRRPASRCPARS